MRKSALYLVISCLLSVVLFSACAFHEDDFEKLPWGSTVSDNRDCVTYKLNQQYVLLRSYSNIDKILWIAPENYPDLMMDSIELCEGNYKRFYCSENQILVCSSDAESITVINCTDKTVSSVSSLDEFRDDLDSYYCFEL